MEEAIEKEKILKDLCKKVGVEYSNTIWSVEQFIDFSRKCYEQGKKDVWEDIDKIINGMTNPIETMKIIIEQLKEHKNEM